MLFRSNQKVVDRELVRLDAAARSDANLIPAILGAVRATATLGEISDALRTSFGTYKPRQEI